jgi:hypothetical protein
VHVTRAPASEQLELRALLRESFEESPELAERCQDFSADRGVDSAENEALLWDEYRIRPLIDTRELWREEKQAPDFDLSRPVTRYPDAERADTVVHTKKGTVYCLCPSQGNSGTWPFKVSKPTATAPDTAAPQQLTASTVRGRPDATKPAGCILETRDASRASVSPSRTGASSYPLPTTAPPGGVAPWSASTTALTTASVLRITSSVARPKRRPASVSLWPS